MSRSDELVVGRLGSIPAGGCCDDCLAKKTGLSKTEVGRLCRRMAGEGRLTRKRGKCALGNHTKVLNMIAVPAQAETSPTISIEEAWRYVDRFCRAMWDAHKKTGPPPSLAEAITTLRDEDLVPPHEANMMHTIRALRNMVVHENLDFGEHETIIAAAALAIVRQWAQKRHREMWRRTMTLCGARAA